ncbi:putative membrane protein YdjX (TVP38/TMEM64 family) [Marmoricola sp. URHA0025 HA25]
MKHFVVYTVLRFALFIAVAAVLSTITVLLFGQSPGVWLASLIVAAVISSVLSLRLLAGPRERFAESVEARAIRARAKLEEIRSREDVD